MPKIKCPKCKEVIDSATAEVVPPIFNARSTKTGVVTPHEGVLSETPDFSKMAKNQPAKEDKEGAK